jgi:PWWP domain
MATINYQVVWAKVRGYPWWPGVVIYKQIETTNSNKYQEASGDHLITLNFIGENTQYLLFSANLNSKFIKDFEKHYNRYSKTNNKVLST